MPNWTGGIITARGRELQAKVEAGETLVITKMKLGSGTPQAYEMDTLTDLKQPLMEFGISSKTVENNICEVTGVVVSSEIETPFYAREWGLFAQDPDEGEILYMYTTDPNPDFIPAKTAALQISATYALNIVVLNVDNIIVNIDPNGLVTTAILKNELKKYLPLSGGDMTGDITANNVYASNNVLVFNSVAEMKASNKVKSGYTIKTLGFYEANDGGGADYVITNDIGEDETDEASIITLQKGLYAKLLIEDYVNVKWLGARGNGSNDDSDFLQKAVNLNKKVLIPDGYYALYKGINLPDIGAGGKATIEGNGQMRTHLICKFDNEDDCLIGVKTEETFSWGIVINHLHISGENHKTDGLYLKGLSYALGNDVNIEKFNGSGFIIDKVFDSEFRNFKVMYCGRNTGDITNNAETEKSAIEIINTYGDDHSNYIKFVNCQFEQQNCSPHVHIKDKGVIAISFIKSHVEATDRQQDFVYCEAGDVQFIDCDLDGSIRYGLTTDGYGNYKVEGGRNFQGIKLNKSGTTCAFLVTNATMDNFDVVAPGGSTLISNSKIENVKWNYPVSGPSFISNCVLNNVVISNKGGNNYDIFIDNCKVGTIETDTNSNNVHLFNCDVGTVNMKGGGHSFINSKYDTLTYYDMANSNFMPRIHEIRDDSAPQYGTWKVGDIVHNTNPTAGSYIGWVCITAGSPGTWKGFGLIQS